MTGIGHLPSAHLTTEPTRAERHLRGQYAVARVLAETASLPEAAPGILEAVCLSLDWHFGALWAVDAHDGLLRCVGVWHPPDATAERFEALTRGLILTPGEGVFGAAWKKGAPTWSADFVADDNARRSDAAAEAGLRSTVVIPIGLDSRILAVMKLYSAEVRPPDQDLMEQMSAIGRQIGQFIDRRRAQEELQRSEARVRDILQSMPAAFYAMDFQFRLTFVNAMAERLMRRPRAELLGRSLWEVVSEALGTPFEDAQRTAMSSRVPVHIEEYYQPFDSWFELHAYPVEEGVSVYFWDVTERKRAEQALMETEARTSAILRSALDCVVTVDHEGRVLEFNPAAERAFGFRRDEVVGRLLVETIVPHHLRDAHREGLARFLRTGEPRVLGQRVELTAIRKDRSEFPVEVAIIQVDAPGPPVFTGFIRDITNRKRNEEERARLLEAERSAREELQLLASQLEARVSERTAELEASNRELEAFSYSVSHDLRAPLRAIDGFSRIVVRDFGSEMPEQAQEYLAIVREGAQQMGRLIDDLLAFSRLGRQSLTKREVQPREVVHRVLEHLRAEVEAREVDIRVLDLPVCRADPALLQQVYANLLTNALKFTRTRSPAIIEIGAEDRDGGHVYFVRDNGVGFDMRYADKLFGVFQRMHKAEDYEGTGVGLALVQRVVHRHGGMIWAEAEPDVGATFLFTLDGHRDAERGDG